MGDPHLIEELLVSRRHRDEPADWCRACRSRTRQGADPGGPGLRGRRPRAEHPPGPLDDGQLAGPGRQAPPRGGIVRTEPPIYEPDPDPPRPRGPCPGKLSKWLDSSLLAARHISVPEQIRPRDRPRAGPAGPVGRPPGRRALSTRARRGPAPLASGPGRAVSWGVARWARRAPDPGDDRPRDRPRGAPKDRRHELAPPVAPLGRAVRLRGGRAGLGQGPRRALSLGQPGVPDQLRDGRPERAGPAAGPRT